MRVAISDKPRVEQRVRALVRARLRDGSGERDICIIDVSTRGLLATTARPPVRGEYVEIGIGSNRLTALVKWSSERRFGLSLRERVSVAAMLEGGSGKVELASSAGSLRKRHDHWAALRAMPRMLAGVGQLGLLVLIAGAAAFLLTEVVTAGFAPMRAALIAAD